MAAAPSPGLYSVSFVATRRRPVLGSTEFDVTHGAEMVQARTEAEAIKVGKAFALFALPTKDGWSGHHAVATAANQVLKPQSEWRK